MDYLHWQFNENLVVCFPHSEILGLANEQTAYFEGKICRAVGASLRLASGSIRFCAIERLLNISTSLQIELSRLVLIIATLCSTPDFELSLNLES